MSRAREKNKKIRKEHQKSLSKYSDNLELITQGDYVFKTGKNPPDFFLKGYVSKKYLVQVYMEPDKPIRISINRNMLDEKMQWVDNIAWDEIQNIKNEIGFKDFDCVEIYPAQKNVVNVANMRHIWVMDKLLDFSWK